MFEALKIRDEMLEQGCNVDVVTYNTILNGLCKEKMLMKRTIYRMRWQKRIIGHVPEAFRLWDEMVGNGIKPTLVNCNTIIKGYCRSGDASRADEFLSKMTSEGIFPDSITYNILFNGFVKEESMDKAFVWTNKMENQGLLPDVIAYNVILNGFCRQGRMQETEMVLRKMVKA
ncbi:hypothetical protein CRYUN_Cryun03dG0123200 [Craigia yunnanensis]